MKQIVAGVLAHVDAGKTTLSEAMLYVSGEVRRLGRVDHGDAFLDTDALEKRRGITIYSKDAIIAAGVPAAPDSCLSPNLLPTLTVVSASVETGMRVGRYTNWLR